MNQIESLLFARKIGKNSTPLFLKHVDLVKALMASPTSTFFADEKSEEYLKRFNNLKVYLSKVFSRRTKPSDEFITLLNEIVIERLADENDKAEILTEIKQLLVPNATVFVVSDNDSHTEELNRRYGKSKTQITFISRPVETYDNKRATQFIDLILDSIFVFNDSITLNRSDIRYEFHFAHYLVAHEFFDRLYRRTLKRLDIPSDKMPESNRLKKKNDELKKRVEDLYRSINSSILRLYAVDELYCTLPVTVFNHTSQDACGFVYFSHDASKFSIAKMSDAAINRWYKNMYLRAKFTRQEITFDTHLKVKEQFGKQVEIIDFNSILSV
ncbi:hypothetical protein JN11_03944 [Mucilaginibacter frigoritolerans]|uniref:Uncharacterized protein n=1 Tax=Mucilaginibacter frigoritolerans TaxID=652788 RepID=A0A562TTA2_9SPHI|nr:hypothetical protein [Mucilaginibacter frigoritolerans]TWI96831.1 hypothetical protein JN11_03944 [Mucilaginibacter frigoritolerans]